MSPSRECVTRPPALNDRALAAPTAAAVVAIDIADADAEAVATIEVKAEAGGIKEGWHPARNVQNPPVGGKLGMGRGRDAVGGEMRKGAREKH